MTDCGTTIVRAKPTTPKERIESVSDAADVRAAGTPSLIYSRGRPAVHPERAAPVMSDRLLVLKVAREAGKRL
jgi:hypothetical protein